MQTTRQQAFTIEELLKILPLDAETTRDITEHYSSWSIDVRSRVNELLWNTFDDYFSTIQQTAYDELFQKKFGDDAYTGNMNLWSEASDAAWHHVAEMLAGKKEDITQMLQIREELKKITSPDAHATPLAL